MKINRHNYEAFLLDRLEGRLSVEEQQELEQFLLQHPDCKAQLSELEPWVLEGEALSYEKPELLKKDFPDHSSVLGEHNFDMFSIARMEGDLGVEQIRAHQAMLERDDRKALQWEQWQRTRLEAEPLPFEGKERLRHKKASSSRMLWIGAISAAAAVALLLVLFRAEPELPQQGSYALAPQEEISGQKQEDPIEYEEPAVEVEAVLNQELPAQKNPSDQTREDPVLKTERGEPATYPLSGSTVDEEAQNNIQAKNVAFTAQQFNSISMLSEANPDQIKPLHIDPVSVQNNGLTLAQLSDQGLQEMLADYVEEKDLSLWKVASAGIRGINRLAGSDISLQASQDEEGEVSGFQLRSKRFSLTRPLGGEE